MSCHNDSSLKIHQDLIVIRGAGKSKGRTSWTGKPEISDYMSVAGFLIQYLDQLEVNAVADGTDEIHLVLGGYSYGSLIASRLPEISSILAPFSLKAPSQIAQEISAMAHDLVNKSGRISRPSKANSQKSEDTGSSLDRQEGSDTAARDETKQGDADGQIDAYASG